MSDQSLNKFLASGTAAERTAFTPDPATTHVGPDPTYVWFETDTERPFFWNFDAAAWAGLTNFSVATTVEADATPVVNSVGYLGSPQMSNQGDYTLTMADAGKHYYHVSGSAHTLTIPDNASVAYPVGTVIGVLNEDSAGNVTIAITSDTLRWGTQTGARTLAANGTASLLKVAATVWRLSGDNIT